MRVSVKKLMEVCHNPFKDPIWFADPIPRHSVQRCIDIGLKNHEVYAEDRNWTPIDHAARIATMVVNGWDSPICLDFGLPSLGHCWYPLLDGHHRLGAAIFLNHEWILGDCSGEVEEINRHVFVDT